ncbi:flavin reductase family protein [Streptomyces flavidovirens]|uniref:flavin reductase family protein n=1 Tax=Streptomyces flavidovirens TaxID=67298 RepID=UPI0034162C35
MERTAFTRTMDRVPGPVAVVTTIDATGRRWGFTASSFSSVSLDPPLVLVCLDKESSTHAAFIGARYFLVNVLAQEQGGVARRFATSGADRFAEGDTQPCELGLPGLVDSCVRVACSMHSVLDGGDHSILVGRVRESYVSHRIPLVYYDCSFTHPVPGEPAADRQLSALHLVDW